MNDKKFIQIADTYKDKALELLGDNYYLNDDYVLCFTIDHTEITYAHTDIKNLLQENNITFWDVIKCPDCGEYTDTYNYVYSKNGDFYVCENCINNYFYCEHCSDYYDDTYDTYETNEGYYVCEHCRFNDFTECHDCGAIVNNNDATYCDDCDNYFCDSCWDDHYHESRLLYDYHEFRDWQPHKTEGESIPEFYIGHELEIDDGSDMREAVEAISEVEGICMHDGSLSDDGIEFISHPFSYKYMLSMEDKYRSLFDHLTNLGYKSHNTSTCGLHFHVTRPQNPKVIDRIILFMETYKEEIFKISRRQSSELNRWSRFLSDQRRSVNEKVIKSLDYIVSNKITDDRYQALNLCNSKTIEFRFFKGTLKYETFMADFEFVNNLVHFASDLDLPIEELTWTKVTSTGRFLPQYIEEHNLKTDKPIIDYSKELLVEFNKEKDSMRIEVDNLIQDVLRDISNRARQKNKTYQKVRETANIIYKLNSELGNLNSIIYDLDNMQPFDYTNLEYDKNSLTSIKRRLNK